MKSLFVLLVLSSVCLGQATAVIEGPKEAGPGDLVILDASKSVCDQRTWILANSDKAFLAVDGGQRCVFASGQPGDYVFILSTARCELTKNSNGEYSGVASIATVKHVLTIKGMPPGPVPPVPVPPPPGPVPVPVPPVPVPLTGVAKRSYDVIKTIQVKDGEVAAVAANLRKVAAQAASLSWSLDKMIAEVAASGRASVFSAEDARTRWAAFNSFFATELKAVATPMAGTELLNGIAEGLEAVQSAPTKSNPPVSGDGTLRGTLQNIRSNLESIQKEVGN
jgi:hypothetical protein